MGRKVTTVDTYEKDCSQFFTFIRILDIPPPIFDEPAISRNELTFLLSLTHQSMYVQDKTLGNRKGALTAFYKSIARIDSIVRSDTWTLFRKGVARYRGDAAKPKRAYTADIFYDSALTLLERYTCFDEIPIIALSYLTPQRSVALSVSVSASFIMVLPV